MEIRVEAERENKLFERKELSLSATYEGKTPTRAEVAEATCKKLGLSPDTFQVVRIDQGYGEREARIIAYSYSSADSMKRFAKREKAKGKSQGAAEKKADKAEEKGAEAAEGKKHDSKAEEAKKE